MLNNIQNIAKREKREEHPNNENTSERQMHITY